MRKSSTLSALREITLFAMFGALMFASKLAFEFLPNVHPIAMFTAVFTIVYGKKALIPLYVFVFLTGIYGGFSMWWLPYLYIWAVLWAAVMLIPKNMPKKIKPVIYCAACALHGLLYGTLYAPAQALMFHMSFSGTVKWIIAGLPYDCIHAAGNLALGILVVPLSELLLKLEKRSKHNTKTI